jgi:hypothetical protein
VTNIKNAKDRGSAILWSRAVQRLIGRNTMRQTIFLAAIAVFLCSCGVETATTAATVATAKKKEIEQGKKTMEQVEQSVGKAMEQTQQSAQRAEEAAK